MCGRYAVAILATTLFFRAGISDELPSKTALNVPNADSGELGASAMHSRGYTPLFNGTDFTGWRHPYPHGEAKVVDGEIHLQGDRKFFLITEKEYTNFRVSVEIDLPFGPANSGVMFRC